MMYDTRLRRTTFIHYIYSEAYDIVVRSHFTVPV